MKAIPTIFDCTSCPSFKLLVPEGSAHKTGACRMNPPQPFPVGVDKLGRPQTLSFWPQVGTGDWCSQHPMAKAFSNTAGPKPFALPQNGPTDPLDHSNGRASRNKNLPPFPYPDKHEPEELLDEAQPEDIGDDLDANDIFDAKGG